jgi:hypothetical protein
LVVSGYGFEHPPTVAEMIAFSTSSAFALATFWL